MKITKEYLKKIIVEELEQNNLNEIAPRQSSEISRLAREASKILTELIQQNPEMSDRLYDVDEKIAHIYSLAKQLEGV